MTCVARFMLVLIAVALCGPSIAQSPQPSRSPPASPGISGEDQIRARLNAWTIGLAGGLLEGAPIHFATEIARVVNDGGAMQVLPIVTRGPTENVNDLLYLKGVDAAIINSDSLEEYKLQVPHIQRRIAYVINLFPSEVHIFVRPEIRSLSDLVGKKVNFNTQGTAAAYSGPLIFSRLGIDVKSMFIPHPVALEQMRRGEIAAVVFVTSKPVDAFVKGKWEQGFRFLPVEYGSKFEDYYVAPISSQKIIPTSLPRASGSPPSRFPQFLHRLTGARNRRATVGLRVLLMSSSAGLTNFSRPASTQNGRASI